MTSVLDIPAAEVVTVPVAPARSALFHGRYRATQFLGRAAGTESFLGTDETTGEPVVIKLVQPAVLPAGTMMRLEHEAATLQQVTSAALQRVIATGRDNGMFVIVSQWLPGRSLRSVLTDSSATLSLSELFAVGRALLAGLRELHEHHVLHRNVRPSNVLLHASGATLLDFGPPPVIDAAKCNHWLEMAHYLSPEQAGLLDHDVSEASDMYSAGAVLFHAAAGRPPFRGATVNALLFEHVTTPAPELRNLGVNVPRALDELIQRLLRKDPRDRYQSAEAALADLEAIADAVDAGNLDPDIVIGAGDRRGTLTEPAFVARTSEIDALTEQLRHTQHGCGGLVHVEGESGGGKTRLLTELAQRAACSNTWVLRGQCTNDVGQRPFQLLDGVVEGFLAAAQANPHFADAVAGRLSAEYMPTLQAALPALAGAWLTAEGAVSAAPEAAGEGRTIQALAEFLRALGTPERPALLILDDCQWADDLTLKLLRRWQQLSTAEGSRCHVMLVVAFRMEEVDEEHLLRRIPSATHLRLQPLSEADVRRLVESMAGRLPDEAVQVITRLADGSPFMASAVMRGLVETQALVPTPHGWRIEPLALNDLQSSSRAAAVLAKRLDLLTPDTLSLLCAGAVLGKEFELDFARQLATQSSAQAVAALDAACQRRLVWLRADGANCVFVHDKIRAAILERLPDAERRALHHQAAEFLKANAPDRISDLAYHYDAAGDSHAALPFALQAAEAARSRHALEIAEQQYRIAMNGALAVEPAAQYRIATGLGDTLMLLGRYDEAGRSFEWASALAATQFDRAQIRGELAELSFKRGDMERAVEDFETALAMLGRSVPQSRLVLLACLGRELVVQALHTLFPRVFVHRRQRPPNEAERLALKLYSGLAHGGYYCRDLAYSMWAHLRGLNLGERFLPSLELAHAYSEHAPAMTLVPYISRARRYSEKSLAIRRDFGDLWGQGQTLHYYGCVLYAASQYEECIEKCREAVRLLERTGDYWQVHIARYQIAASLYRLGDWHGALEEAQLNYRSGLELKDEQASGIILDVWARCSPDGVPDDILQPEVTRSRHDVQGVTQVLLAKGITEWRRGQWEAAALTLTEAIAAADRAGVKNPYTLPALTWLATACRTGAEKNSELTPHRREELLGRAERAVQRALRESRLCRNDLPQAYRERALLHAMRGRPTKARKWFQRSLDEAQRQRARCEYALTLQAWARVGRELGWPDTASRQSEAEASLLLLQPLRSADGRGPAGQGASLSLLDRFDTILDAGREIATALTPAAVFEHVRTTALRLLRGQHCVVLEQSGDATLRPLAGAVPSEIDRPLLQRALSRKRAVAAHDEPSAVRRRNSDAAASNYSALCAPLFVRGKPIALIYVVHDGMRDLFGPEEERLADFITAIAGAALENAEGFSQLQDLNATLEKRVEERTEQLQEANRAVQAANEAKSRFLATMSHEIRTPMNGIIGMTELTLTTPLTDHQRNSLTIVKESSHALLVLLNDILDFSKIEAGRMDLEHIPFDVRDVVGDACRLLAVEASRKGLELVCHVTGDVPRELIGDPNRVRQIVVNLVGNALKFTERGEVVVRVNVESVPDTTERPGHCTLHFSVRDSGIGIPPDKQQSIFEAFRQSDSSMTRRFGGTGLGLSISSQLTSLMGGRIWVESEPGRGSTFHVVIPLEGSPAPKASPLDAEPLAGRRVLLVASHPDVREAHVESLAQGGATVCVANTAESALVDVHWHEQSQRPYDVVVIDVGPQDEGLLDVASRFATGQLAKRLPVVVLLPAGRATEVERCRELGLTHCLTKPAKRRELWNAIAAAVSGPDTTQTPCPATVFTPDAEPLRILVADDSPVNQAVAQGLLELLGHNVECADDGCAAVEAWAEGEFDIVFLDLEMPELDGISAAKQIRARESETGERVPIFAMTAHAIPGFREQCAAAGMDGYITKPVQVEELRAALDTARARSVAPC